MRCTVEGISYDGAGVARINGRAVFIPFAIPGETVDIDITSEKNRYSLGKLKKILEPSPDRVEPVCPHYYECGGCSYQHITYDSQLKFKRQVVADNLKRIGKVEVQVNDPMGMEYPWHYRNKVTWHIKNGRLGYYAENTNQLVTIEKCLLLTEKMEDVSRKLAEHLSKANSKRHGEAVIRQSSVNGEIMAVFREIEVADEIVSLLKQCCASIYINEHNRFELVWGKPFLQEQINDLSFRLSPGSFFQVNHTQMLKLIAKVLEYLDLRGNEDILDAYCGIGSISLPLAQKCASVTGIESLTAAVKDAEINASMNKLINCEFLAGPCEKLLPQMKKCFDAVVLDPPRSGCKKDVIAAITHPSPSRIVYVSCNPATLARDLGIFTEQGYQVKEVQPVDMFPWTRHVECCVLLYRKDYIGEKGKKVTVEVGMNK